jgi:hypothetical protein
MSRDREPDDPLLAVWVANQPVSLRELSRSGFVVRTPVACRAGRLCYCSFRVSNTLTVTLQARCISTGHFDDHGMSITTFEFLDSESEACRILASAFETGR